MFTFKAQAKSNAKRFLITTCKLDPASLDSYLIQVGGEWGTYLGADGKPVPHEQVEGSAGTPVATLPTEAETAALATATATDANEYEPVNAPSASAFGAFALSQLGAAAPAPAPADEPAGATRAPRDATPTSGLKIQKDRPMQNGQQRQSAGSVGDKLWALYDAAGPTVTLQQAKALAEGAGLSVTSAAIALYNWRRFNGIVIAK